MMGATCGAGTAYPSRAPEFTPQGFSGVCVARSLVFCLYILLIIVCPFGLCVACPFSIYGFCLLLWYLQTFFFTNVRLN
jgi:hypothetical protein